MSQSEPTIQDLLQEDIEILLHRFNKFQFDAEEKKWHLKRYFNNLNTDDPQVLAYLEQALAERIAVLEGKGTLNAEEQYTYQALQQFYKDTVDLVSKT